MPQLALLPVPANSHPIQSDLFHSLKGLGTSHDFVVPPTDQLEALLKELQDVKKRSLEVQYNALRTNTEVQKSLESMREKEQKVKKERESFTPILSPGSPDDAPLSQLLVTSNREKARHGTPSTLDDSASYKKKSKDSKNKKRKRDRDDDADEPHRRLTPVPPASISVTISGGSGSVSGLKPSKTSGGSSGSKLMATATSSSSSHKEGALDFRVPEMKESLPESLLPAKPPESVAPTPYPMKPEDVMEDFSKSKQPQNQTAITNFYSAIEPYLRPIKEEDIGFLEYDGDEVEPFVIPPLGRHYREVWADQDEGIVLAPGQQEHAPPPSAPNPSFDPSQLNPDDLLGEDVGHGPLTERCISALLPDSSIVWKGVKAAEDGMEGRPGGSGAAASKREKSLVSGKSGLEERLGGTLRYHGILDPSSANVPDYSDATSDPIATALRQAQGELRAVMARNKKRRAEVAEKAKDLLSYQEYLSERDNLDRHIVSSYHRLQKDQRRAFTGDTGGPNGVGSENGEKKKKKRAARDDQETKREADTKYPIPACASGLGPDGENRLVVGEMLQMLVGTRGKWVDVVGGEVEGVKPRIGSRMGDEMGGGGKMEDVEESLGDAMDIG